MMIKRMKSRKTDHVSSWIINNGAEWRRKRNERREMKRSRRASRMLQGLQRARYQQQQQEVMLV